jgi:hypothetical protein
MQQADRLIEQLRAAPPPGVRVASPAPPAPASGPVVRPARALPNASVPVVLLSLGGLCLLVAAIVFVAVAWSSLGLAAKTVILLAVTGLFAAGAVAVTRRSLRFAAETLWLVVSGLVFVDLTSAYAADLLGLGRLGDRSAVALIGAALLGLAVALGAWATTTPLHRLHGLVGVAAIGTCMLAGAEAWRSDHNPGAVAISVPVLALLAIAIDRATNGHLRATAGVVGAAAVVSWLELVGYGLDRMATTDTVNAWWTDLAGWPLLAAAALAAVPAATGRGPEPIRMATAGAGLVTLGLFGVGPGSGPTADLLTWAVVSALVAAVSAAAPRVWAVPAAFLSAVALIGWGAWTLARPLDVILRLPGTAPDHGARLDSPLPMSAGGPAPWTAVVAALVVGAAAGALLRHLPGAARGPSGRAVVALGPGLLALAATTGLLETEPTLLVAVLAWSGTLVVTAGMAIMMRDDAPALGATLVAVTYLVVTGLRLTVPSHVLSALFATVVSFALAVAYAKARRSLLGGLLLPALAAPTVLLAGFAATHWPYLFDGHGDAVGLTMATVSAAALLLAAPAARDLPSRVTLELTGLVVGLAGTAFPNEATTVAMVLTVVGSAVAVVSILHRDRDEAAWIGVVLLGFATVIRVAEDVRAPELVTLPAAALLLVAGWWRLGSDPVAGSVRALSSGLTLALAPSLLLALDEPVSLRGILVAAGGLACLAVGAARLWSAPFVAGALTTGVLAVRHLGPVVDGLPRWISLGTVGVLLLLVGVTWEQRRQDVAAAGRYLASLR